MWKYLGPLILVTSALLLQACAPKSQDDCGFVQNVYGERISWKGQYPITIWVHESVPQEYMGAIVAAANTWRDATGKSLFNIVTDQKVSGPLNPQKDSRNIIYFLNSWEEDKSSEQARTSIYWIGDQIKEADMRINGKFTYYWNQPGITSQNRVSSVNIEALIIHELGHVLGLKHKDNASSVMATYLSNNTDRVNIADTDKTALQCEY
ncbi:MAG: matrixin family metalloprotease [Proteobacteria bacterium]|nr:MAG: matrixin family metalloprotease [Pseudomonadota bacterium]